MWAAKTTLRVKRTDSYNFFYLNKKLERWAAGQEEEAEEKVTISLKKRK